MKENENIKEVKKKTKKSEENPKTVEKPDDENELTEEIDDWEEDKNWEGVDLIESLQNEINDLKDSKLRQMAEFDNFRKRFTREKLELYGNAVSDTVLSFLPALDNLERAVQSETEESGLKKGLTMVLSQFKDIFESLQIKEIECENKPFDPEIHNAAGQREDENFESNTVCEVLQKGYMYKEKVIRHPMVIVANP